MEKTVKIPVDLIRKLYEIQKINASIIETLEEILDEEGMERIKEGIKEIERGDFVKADINEIDDIL